MPTQRSSSRATTPRGTRRQLPPWPDAPPVMVSREAARYCRMSYERFRQLEASDRCPPHADVGVGGGAYKSRRYTRAALDLWLGGQLVAVPEGTPAASTPSTER